MLSVEEKIIIALDFSERTQVENFIRQTRTRIRFVKVGMQLYYREGKSIIDFLKQQGLKIFLDLKLHDIPNTVEQGIGALCAMGVDMINVHASGGLEMMKAAHRAVGNTSTQLIAVTQLTSISQDVMNSQLNVPGRIDDQVVALASLSKQAGINGVVCSAGELVKIKKALGQNFCCVTPGIRLYAPGHDQKRIATPKQAFADGADYIVVGREVTAASDPQASFCQLVESI